MPAGNAHAFSICDQFFHGAVGAPAVGEDVGAHALGLRIQFGLGHAEIGQAHGRGLRAGIGARGEHHLVRAGDADAARKALRQAPDWHEVPLGVRVGELRSVGGDDDVCREREFEPACEAMAAHGGDHRHRQSSETFDDPGFEALDSAFLAAASDVVEIVACAKAAPGAGQKHATDRRGGDAIQVCREITEGVALSALSFSGRLRVSRQRPSAMVQRMASPGMVSLAALYHCCTAVQNMKG